ncbi:MAG: type I glyceraldehyde-3-phosphate dehydrogenase [Rhodobacteraceae bacterium]|nr:type I glyceraldehyde-3-phosphate dehydrogenase [Paracoccaceae bacterium]
MMTKIAINGFGRIGRCVLRALYESGRDDLEVVAINDLAAPESLAHALAFDSVHGRFAHPVTVTDTGLDAGRGPIRVTAERNPEDLDWSDVDVALDCTGIFTNNEGAARHLQAGAGKVLISAPAKGSMKTIVFGVNHDQITAEDKVISNGSCTTNCLAPVAHVLHEALGIKRGTMTTVHAYTSGQPVHDRADKDFARSRAGTLSMIPTSTGAAKAIGLVLPHLEGRLFGTSIRVPTPNVSCVDLTVEVETATDIETVNALFRDHANGAMAGVLAVEDRTLVSIDFNHWPASSTVSTGETAVVDGHMIRILSWYDNEWGFSNRMLDVARVMAG